MLIDSNLQSTGDKETEKTNEIGIQSDIQSDRHEQETIESALNALSLVPSLLTTFPLLSLPDEIIGYIYSFLPIKDRMRARLCKRLDNVEMQHKYYVPRFNIDEKDAKITLWKKLLTNDNDNMEMAVETRNSFNTEIKPHGLFIDRGFPIESLKRIMKNATFGFLYVNITGYGEGELIKNAILCAWRIYRLLPECNIDELKIIFPFSLNKDEMVDKYLFLLIDACYKLKLGCTGQLTAAGLNTLYKRIMDRTCKLYYIDFEYAPAGLLKEFLLLIGIKFEGGELFSERNVEAYNFKDVLVEAADDEEGEELFRMNKHVFDNNLEMIFGNDEDDTTGWLSMNYHRTKEDVVKAKSRKGLVKLEVSP